MNWPTGLADVIGGNKEEPTRRMILAGKAWIDSHPGIAPQFRILPGAILVCENDAAEDLLAVIKGAAPRIDIEIDGKQVPSFDEGMIQTAVNHCSFIRNWGWTGYQRSMTPK